MEYNFEFITTHNIDARNYTACVHRKIIQIIDLQRKCKIDDLWEHNRSINSLMKYKKDTNNIYLISRSNNKTIKVCFVKKLICKYKVSTHTEEGAIVIYEINEQNILSIINNQSKTI